MENVCHLMLSDSAAETRDVSLELVWQQDCNQVVLLHVPASFHCDFMELSLIINITFVLWLFLYYSKVVLFVLSKREKKKNLEEYISTTNGA